MNIYNVENINDFESRRKKVRFIDMYHITHPLSNHGVVIDGICFYTALHAYMYLHKSTVRHDRKNLLESYPYIYDCWMEDIIRECNSCVVSEWIDNDTEFYIAYTVSILRIMQHKDILYDMKMNDERIDIYRGINNMLGSGSVVEDGVTGNIRSIVGLNVFGFAMMRAYRLVHEYEKANLKSSETPVHVELVCERKYSHILRVFVEAVASVMTGSNVVVTWSDVSDFSIVSLYVYRKMPSSKLDDMLKEIIEFPHIRNCHIIK